MDAKEFFYEFGKLLYRIDGFYDEFAKKSGVKPNLLWILYALADGKEHSQKEICDTWELARSTVNTIIGELKEDGYVTLVQIEGERRELLIKLTEEGKKYSDKLLKSVYDNEARVYEELKDDAQTLLCGLQKLDNSLRRGQ